MASVVQAVSSLQGGASASPAKEGCLKDPLLVKVDSGCRPTSPKPKTVGSKPTSPKPHDHCHKNCTSEHHEPGMCHGFEVHKPGQWMVAHGDINIMDCQMNSKDIEEIKVRRDVQLLSASAAVMALVMTLELFGGFTFNSLALFSDGMHYASDVALYLWLLFSVLLSKRKEDISAYSFGYHRAQVLGSLIALLMQYLATGLLVYLAVMRLTFEPHFINGGAVGCIGAVSLLANLGLLTLMPAPSTGHGHSHGSGGDAAGVARVHMLGDVVQGFAVILTGFISWVDPSITWADPSSTFVYACVVFGSSWSILQELLATLMERAPMEVDVKGLFDDMAKIKGVVDVHCCHVWALAPGKVALSAHLHIEDNLHEEVLHKAQILCKHKYGIGHSTLQISEDEDLA